MSPEAQVGSMEEDMVGLRSRGGLLQRRHLDNEEGLRHHILLEPDDVDGLVDIVS
jgi:hypothetical protein